MSLPYNFDYKVYLLLNPDLNQHAGYEEACSHYLTFGIKEGRNYFSDKINAPINDTKMCILVVVVSCNKHKNLWSTLKDKTKNLIIISGTNDRSKPIFFNKKNKILWINCNDYYDGLPEKIVLTIEEILKNPKFRNITHILKIDDHDTFFNNDHIENLYKCPDLQIYDYLGQKKNCWYKEKKCNYHFGKVPKYSYWHNRTTDISNITYFDGGCSYILNRKAMQLINNKYNSSNIDELRVTEIYEDVMVGRILLNNNTIKYKELNYEIKGDK